MTDILIVILIFAVILIWSEMGIRRIIKAKKYKEELVETRINDCKKEYDNFVEKYSSDPILSKSNWFEIKKRYLKRFLDKMDDENVFLFAFEVSEKLDLVTEDFFTMVEIIANIENEVEDVKTTLKNAPGVVLEDNPEANVYPLALNATGHDEVYVGRVRRDESVDNGINFWVVADNIRKGAATNAVQIAELLIEAMQ